MEHLQWAVPVLLSHNIARSGDFYKKKPGFTEVGWQDKDYAVIGRDKVQVHFWKCNNRIYTETPGWSTQKENLRTNLGYKGICNFG